MKAMMYKWMLGFLTLLLTMSAQASISFNGSPWYDYRDESLKVDGNGTLLDPIVITTPEQLAQLAWLVNEKNNTFEGKVIVLAADINLTKEDQGKRVVWLPIGFKNSFKGNAKEQVQELLKSGKMSQEQFQQLSKMAEGFQGMFNK
jgi:hypothetical protein